MARSAESMSNAPLKQAEHEVNIHRQVLQEANRLFTDPRVKQYLEEVTLSINNGTIANDQDITFMSGYIISMFTLQHFKFPLAAVQLTAKEFLTTRYEEDLGFYLISSDKLGHIVFKKSEYAILDFYYHYVRPEYVGSSGNSVPLLSQPLLLNASGTMIRKPEQLVRRAQTTFDLTTCTPIRSRDAMMFLLNKYEPSLPKVHGYINCKLFQGELLTQWRTAVDARCIIFNLVDKEIENLCLDTGGPVTNDVAPNCCEKVDKYSKQKLAKSNFLELLSKYPVVTDCSPPTLAQVKALLDQSITESKRMIAKWKYQQNLLRVKSLPDCFRSVPSDVAIDIQVRKLGWKMKFSPTYYERIRKDCSTKKRGQNDSNILKITDTKSLQNYIGCQEWPSVYIKDNLPGRGRGVFACSLIVQNQVVCNFEGKYMSGTEGEEMYQVIGGCYFFNFHFNSKYHYIDASEENGTYGRLINHSALHANLKPVPQIVLEGNQPEIIFVAMRDIVVGEELFWNYGKKANLEFYDTCHCTLCSGEMNRFPVIDLSNQ